MPMMGSVRCSDCARRTYQCTVEGCIRRRSAKGRCSTHYAHDLRSRAAPCSVEGCGKQALAARGYCYGHYDRWRKYGDPRVRRNAENGSGTVVHGYRRSMRNGIRKPEHVWIMEATLGRDLLPGETVHHRNGIALDNRPENLELWSSNHPSGQRVEDLIEWAKGLLALYESSALAER